MDLVARTAWIAHAGRRAALAAALASTGLGLGGCPSPEVAFDSPSPLHRAIAIAEADPESDAGAIPGLIGALDSTEPEERMFAIHRLESITGERFGYRHEAPRAVREASVERWRRWYEQQSAGADGGPAGRPSEGDSP